MRREVLDRLFDALPLARLRHEPPAWRDGIAVGVRSAFAGRRTAFSFRHACAPDGAHA